jgi:hypothetical protein
MHLRMAIASNSRAGKLSKQRDIARPRIAHVAQLRTARLSLQGYREAARRDLRAGRADRSRVADKRAIESAAHCIAETKSILFLTPEAPIIKSK